VNPWELRRDAGQTDDFADRRGHLDRRDGEKRGDPDRPDHLAGAWVGLGADRSDDLLKAGGHDCRSARGRDFQ